MCGEVAAILFPGAETSGDIFESVSLSLACSSIHIQILHFVSGSKQANDLKNVEAWRFLLWMAQHQRLLIAFMAPPTYTFSASASPLSPLLPFRTVNNLLGCCGLDVAAQQRCDQHSVFGVCCARLAQAIGRSGVVAIETIAPAHHHPSLFSLPSLQIWCEQSYVYQTFTDACMFGSPIRRRLLYAANFSDIVAINRICNHSHGHSGLPDADGRAFSEFASTFARPALLSQALADALVHEVVALRYGRPGTRVPARR